LYIVVCEGVANEEEWIVSTASEQWLVIDALIERIEDGYIFPERAATAATLLRSRRIESAYNVGVSSELCELLSADLFAACGDKHLRVLWHETVEESRDDADLATAKLERYRVENHGVRRVEQLEGNVGLIELTIIPPVEIAGGTMAAAMQMVRGTDALIFDLRRALGGVPDGVAFLCSFLFPDGGVHLEDVVEGPKGTVRELWTLPHLPGPRYLDRPVYVLVGPRTFSGGESFAYDLQAQGRATIVGEPTGGGAHPVVMVSLAEHVELRLPTARSVNPVTGTNWETVGVQPDIHVPTATALSVAYELAVKTITASTSAP
jgi:C-terminal processing protease CtpA/Prc